MSKLHDILSNAVNQATSNPNIPTKCELKRGLVISVTATKKNYSVSIARDDTYPSPQEWKTIIEHWPYYTPPADAIQFIDADNRFALRGSIPKRHMQQLQF